MIHPEEIEQIVTSIWMSILDLPIVPASAGPEGTRPVESRTLTGCVQFTGDFEGATVVHTTAALARRLAAVMFMAEEDSLSLEEVQDALGEITNMIAGNIKPLLPGSSRISLPSVVEGEDYTMIVPGSRSVCRASFECGNQPLLVTVQQRQERPDGI